MDVEVEIDGDQAHYLITVMRVPLRGHVRLFNGRDGEWLAEIVEIPRRRVILRAVELLRRQTSQSDIHYLFAPLKHARVDYLAQKATELGAVRLRPILTERTVARRVNVERLRANAIEAAEQCNLLAIPSVDEPIELIALLDCWPPDRTIIFCDEAGVAAGSLMNSLSSLRSGPLAVLVGPEGGFSPAEREQLCTSKAVLPVSLGPRIMRADTAAIAALTLVQATLEKW